jgi:AraC-like DNA-binding protein
MSVSDTIKPYSGTKPFPFLNGTEAVSTHKNDVFLALVIRIIQKHISDFDFSVEQLAGEVGLSRTHLYRKISEITHRSVSHLIRRVRLEHAARLIREQQGTILQTALEVGFSNPSYFSSRFRETYGRLPSKYTA